MTHNFQGYDGYFIVDQCHQQCQLLDQIPNGAKLLQVTQDRIRYIDSLSFLRMPLSAFPKTFGLTELKRGTFHINSTPPDHQHYVGPIPAKDYYMPEVMSPDGRKKFEEWHNQQKDKTFDFAKELVDYCESDVTLLKEGCLCFKRLFEQHTHFNPFDQMTIASACNRDLRMNRMQPNTIASEPLHGWRRKTNQSHKAFEWLYWTDRQLRTDHWNGLTEEERETGPHGSQLSSFRSSSFQPSPGTRQEPGRTSRAPHQVHGGRVRFHQPYGVRVPRMLLARIPDMLPDQVRIAQPIAGQNDGRLVSPHAKKMQFLRDKGYTVVKK